MQISIRAPQTEQEWDQYYDLRWRVLRQPWQQPRGSEKDELENSSVHRLAISDSKVIAVGRLHFTENNTAQIRYMAVDPEFQRQGIGQMILQSLEKAAREKNSKCIELNARESALNFYQHQQYKLIEPAHTLYQTIKHFKMKKDY